MYVNVHFVDIKKKKDDFDNEIKQLLSHVFLLPKPLVAKFIRRVKSKEKMKNYVTLSVHSNSFTLVKNIY